MVGMAMVRGRGASGLRWVAVLVGVVAGACSATPTDAPDGATVPSAGAPDPGSPSARPDDGAAQPDEGAGADVAVDTIYHAGASGLTDPTRAVIASASEWEAAWARITSLLVPAPDVPAVDFGSAQVVLIGLGQRPSGGYGIELAGVDRAEGAITVTVREVRPGPGCLTTQALTQPVLALALASGSDQVQFREETLVRDCS